MGELAGSCGRVAPGGLQWASRYPGRMSLCTDIMRRARSVSTAVLAASAASVRGRWNEGGRWSAGRADDTALGGEALATERWLRILQGTV